MQFLKRTQHNIGKMDKTSIFIEIKRPTCKKQENKVNSKFQIKKNSKLVLNEEENNFFCFESKNSLNEASTYYNDRTYRNIFDITFDDGIQYYSNTLILCVFKK